MTDVTPLSRYKQLIADGSLREDSDQLNALQYLNRICLEVNTRASTRSHGFFKKHKPKPIKGLYMYGGVGRGKTLLMDLFFDTLPVPKKMRMHFYRFMSMVHGKLKDLEGQCDRLEIVAKDIAKEAKVICFDEFIVEDIADAMILGLLFEALFAENVVIVATSNVEPDHLYEGGLQRDRFMPAIAEMKKNMDVICVDAGNDYRVETKAMTSRYFTPLTEQREFMEAQFDTLSHGEDLLDNNFELSHRAITAIKRSKSVVWFDFTQICQGPRSPDDYIALANTYQAVLVSNVPQFYEALDNEARRFIALVDELYDNGILLILSAQVPIMDLYSGKQLEFVFERTKSRLIEMQGDFQT